MKTKSIFKSFLSVILSVAMISVLVLSPMLSAGAAESTAHTQPSNGVYVYTRSGDGQDYFCNLGIKVISGKTYTFTALWKAGTDDKTWFKVNDTIIINGSYNVQNGATFNPATGRISYTFTASSNTAKIELENRAGDICVKNYSFADPQIFESDVNGNAVTNGDVADCDVDFCATTSWHCYLNWGSESDNIDAFVSVGSASEFSTVHGQPSDGIYVYKAGGDESVGDARYGQNNFENVNVKVVSGKTYTFSALWKAGANDKTLFIVNGTTIINGSYNVQNGAIFNPYTGSVSYTFTATSDTVTINLENRGDTIQEKNYSFAAPQIFESDVNGNAVANGDIADCDVDFCKGTWSYNVNWGNNNGNRDDYVSVGSASDFVEAKEDVVYEKPDDGNEFHVFTFKYNDGIDGWNPYRYENSNIKVIAGKRYNFNMLWKDLGNCGSIIKVNGTEILNGGYNAVNGATFDPTTGRLSYTFVASSINTAISIENLDETNKRYKNYSFADPRMYEVDSNGNRIANGDEADCDGDFYGERWNVRNYADSIVDPTDDMELVTGNTADFVLRYNHSGTAADGKSYAVSYLYSYTERNVTYSPFVFKGRTYTFSMYYKVFGSTTTRMYVDGTKILDGDYNVMNGAEYDAYTGLITYTFTAASNKAKIELDNLGGDNSQKYHSYKFAAPALIETDANGNAIANGDIADCDPDFCKWNSWNWNNPSFNILDVREEIELSAMPERRTPHTQPSDDTMYVLSYPDDYSNWTRSSLHKDLFVLKGKTYTLQMLWKDYTKTTHFSVDGTVIIEGSSERMSTFKNGAVYDVQTGLLTYTFTASKNIISLVFENCDETRKNHYYEIANPLIFESDAKGNAIVNGDVADCDVDFCDWYTMNDKSEKIANEFTVTKRDDFGFGANVKFGDVNNDGTFNIIDLVVTKKQLAGTYTGEFNYMSLGKSGTDKTLDSEDLAFVRTLLLGVANGRSKEKLASLISVLHNDDGKYALGANLAGSTKVAKTIEAFEGKLGGKPSYVDYDMCSLPFISESNKEYLIAQLVRYNKEGGFTALTSHWLVPTQKLSETSSGGANNSRHTLTATEYAKVYTPGNELYNNFREELAIEAEFIGMLKNYGISVIYRPLHECNYGSFWWCINTENSITPSMVATLYNYVHDYFTNDCGLDNIIWQFNADAKHDTSSLVSPANVDMLSLDCYLTDVIDLGIPADYENLSKICGDKTFAISEFYAVNPGEYGYNITSMLNRLEKDFKYKFAYLGIYCDLENLAVSVLPSSVLTLSDTADISR